MEAKKSLALAALVAGKSRTAAATAAGITDRTLRRWLSDDEEFATELAQARADILDGLKRKVVALGEAAIGGYLKALKGEMGQTAHYRASADILRSLGVIGAKRDEVSVEHTDEIDVSFGDFKPETPE